MSTKVSVGEESVGVFEIEDEEGTRAISGSGSEISGSGSEIPALLGPVKTTSEKIGPNLEEERILLPRRSPPGLVSKKFAFRDLYSFKLLGSRNRYALDSP